MALSDILALVSLAAALLLVAQALPWSRPGGAGDALLQDLLHGVGLLDLATRSNMILLCHAILVALLGNAGILTPNKHHAAAAADVEEHRRPWWWPAGTSREPEPPLLHVPTTTREEEVVVVHRVEEKQGTLWRTGTACLIHAAGELHHQPAATADDDETVSPTDIAFFHDDDQEKVDDGAAEEQTPRPEEEWALVLPEQGAEEAEEEEEVDLDEMNRRFEAFIAATKEKMRMEVMHPSPAENRPVLLAC